MKWSTTVLSIAVLGILALGLASTSAYATTTTGTMVVTATIAADCSVSTNPLGFGTYTATSPSTATANISVTCTNTTTYDIGLDPGTSTSATVTTRAMEVGGGTFTPVLNYGLYQDSGHSTNWGQTVSTDTLHKTGSGSAQSWTIYGLIPSGQYQTPGAYTDTVTATITW
jgi:spore coat protein U-like protein